MTSFGRKLDSSSASERQPPSTLRGKMLHTFKENLTKMRIVQQPLKVSTESFV